MIDFSPFSLSLTLSLPITLAICFLGGLLLGYAYFHALRETADLIVDGSSPLLAIALTLGRVCLLSAGFYAAALAGGFALLAALAGVLCAKGLLLGQVKRNRT